MNDDALKSIINGELDNALGIGTGQLANERRRALEYYKGKATGELAPSGIVGRSTVVSTDVLEAVEWMLPALIRMFTQQKTLAEFTAKEERFESAAKQAAQYIGNHIFYTQNDGFNILQTSFKDALISKNAFIKVYWCEEQTDNKELYKGIGDLELQDLLDSTTSKVVSVKPSKNSGTNGEQTYDVVVKPNTKGQVKIEVIPPEDVRIHSKAKDCDSARFIAHRFEKTISELKAEGYEVPEDLVSDSRELTQEHWTRSEFSEPDITNSQESDPSMKVVVGWECYIKVDYDQDGIAELRKVTVVNNTILDNVEVSQNPFVTLTPIINPHQFFGTSVADLAIEPQKTKTVIQRAAIDNLLMGINSRTWAVKGQVDLASLLDSRPGGVVVVDNPNAVGTLPTSSGDMNGAMSLMQQLDAAKERKTGLTSYSMGGDSPLISGTATGANILTNRADARLELIGRNFANSLKKVVWKVLHLVSVYQDEPQRLKLGDKWVDLDPREWKDQFNLEVTVGLGTNNKQETLANLQVLQTTMEKAGQAGIVKPANVFNAAVKIAETLGFSSPESYFSSPDANLPDPQLMEQVTNLTNQLEETKAFNLQTKQERDAFELMLTNKQAELNIKARELEIKAQELELKKIQTQAAILENQQKLKLEEHKTSLASLQKQQELDHKAGSYQ